MTGEIYFVLSLSFLFFFPCLLLLLLCLSLSKYKWNINGKRFTHLHHCLCISMKGCHFFVLFFFLSLFTTSAQNRRDRSQNPWHVCIAPGPAQAIQTTLMLIVWILFIHLSSFTVFLHGFYEAINDKVVAFHNTLVYLISRFVYTRREISP